MGVGRRGKKEGAAVAVRINCKVRTTSKDTAAATRNPTKVWKHFRLVLRGKNQRSKKEESRVISFPVSGCLYSSGGTQSDERRKDNKNILLRGWRKLGKMSDRR